MADTILFAPQVRAVQPAFEYSSLNKSLCKIYFSVPSFMSVEVISAVQYLIIDPNCSSLNGENNMLKAAEGDGWTTVEFQYDNSLKEYYFEIMDPSVFKNFNVDQYYQIQLRFLAKDGAHSNSSQISLLRPISGWANAEIQIVSPHPNTSLDFVEGYIKPTKNSKECLAYYQYSIQQGGEVIYTSSQLTSVNGLYFKNKIDFPFEEGNEYQLQIKFTTVNGYQLLSSWTTLNIASPTEDVARAEDNGCKIEFLEEPEMGGIQMDLEWAAGVTPAPQFSKIIVQRTDEYHNYKHWKTVASFTIEEAYRSIFFSWRDCSIEGKTAYKYRVLFYDNEGTVSYASKEYSYGFLEDQSSLGFEHIYLSDSDIMLAITYNSNISGFKWVTQETLMNSLGGKFPVVRINGDTKYRQFSLSGTLYFNPVTHSQPLDSCGTDLSKWLREADCGLYLSNELYSYYQKTLNWQAPILEKRMREIAMDFLTNQKFKLYRSREEGNMIVYLSGVSFTPNKTLGRTVWDFSATVTEVCEITDEVLGKYNFNVLNKDAYEYRLEVEDDLIAGRDGMYSPVISINQLLNDSVILKAAKVAKYE